MKTQSEIKNVKLSTVSLVNLWLIHKNQTATSERVPRIWSKEITIWQEMFYSYSNKSLLVINCCDEALPQNKRRGCKHK